jgi:hypothetical protein
MNKIKNFDIVVNTCMTDIESRSKKSDFDENDFLLSVVNGFEDGKWREDLFRQFVMNNIAQTGLSAEERENICTVDPYTQITRSIKNLRLVDSENGQGSEIAEIVLYGIMRYHYHALPVVPKIFYKQNSNDNAKGADSVHVVIDEDNMDFTLWFGEAKFFNDITDDRLYNPISSVFEMLSTEKIKKENSIITNIKDLEYVIDNPDIRKKVKEVLCHDASIDEVKKRLHIPIMLLHECNITQGATELSHEYLEEIKQYHLNRAERFFMSHNNKQKKVGIYGFENITFHLILFPVPNKEKIVNWFVERTNQIKQDA